MNECCVKKNEIKKLSFKFTDYFKALFCYINSFKKTLDVIPGLYYTSDAYDIESPMIVTCNYFLTVFLLWRKIKNKNVRILIIDTKGINVWCSSGKGQFNSEEILKVLNQYNSETITKGKKLSIVLPKLSLSGVSLKELRKNLINPIIGPIYMKDLIKFLDNNESMNTFELKYKFNLKDRLFTLTPSTLQFLKYILYFCLGFFIYNYYFHTKIYYQPFLISLVISIVYILFFPLLPTKKFALKGLFLGILLNAIFLLYHYNIKEFNLFDLSFYIIFNFAVSIWFGLYYTGNSGVSNYSLVKKEIAIFLPIAFLTLLSSIVIIIVKGAVL